MKQYAANGTVMIKTTFFKAAFRRSLTLKGYYEFSPKITSPVRLMLITDLHSTLYGPRQEVLLNAIRRCRPDLILLSGDIADHRVPHQGARLLLSGIAADYPCFYVSGNHEQWTGKMDAIKEAISALGVTVLDGGSCIENIRGQLIQISGVDDPTGFTNYPQARRVPRGWKRQFAACRRLTLPPLYSILLSHRPELTRFYRDSGFDLVAAGHAHGGQVRLPGLINGLLAPHQGFFPRYAGGRYRLGRTTMIVSRGLCLNRLPRIFNPPELVIVELRPAPKPSCTDF